MINFLVVIVLDCFEMNLDDCLILTGKDQQLPEPSKRPKSQTASVRRKNTNVVEETGGPARQQRKFARKQGNEAQAQALHAEADAAAAAVEMPEGAPVAVLEVEAASSPVVPDLEGTSSELELDSEGEELSESKFVVGVREGTVPKRKKKDVEGPL
jgi:hypothetical protein